MKTYIRAALFWIAMILTIVTTMVMIYEGVPFYVYNEVAGRITISPWWLLNGVEMPVVAALFLPKIWRFMGIGLLLSGAFCLGLELYVHVEMTGGWDATAKFELAHIGLFLVTALLALYSYKGLLAE